MSKTHTWLANLWDRDPVPATAVTAFGDGQQAHKSVPMFTICRKSRVTMPTIMGMDDYFYHICFTHRSCDDLHYATHEQAHPCLGDAPGMDHTCLNYHESFTKNNIWQTFPLIHDIAFISMKGGDLPARVIQGTAISAPQSKGITWLAPAYVRPLWGQFDMDTWRNEGAAYPFTIITQPGKVQVKTGKPIGMITWGVEGIIPGAQFHRISRSLRLTEILQSPARSSASMLWKMYP